MVNSFLSNPLILKVRFGDLSKPDRTQNSPVLASDRPGLGGQRPPSWLGAAFLAPPKSQHVGGPRLRPSCGQSLGAAAASPLCTHRPIPRPRWLLRHHPFIKLLKSRGKGRLQHALRFSHEYPPAHSRCRWTSWQAMPPCPRERSRISRRPALDTRVPRGCHSVQVCQREEPP